MRHIDLSTYKLEKGEDGMPAELGRDAMALRAKCHNLAPT